MTLTINFVIETAIKLAVIYISWTTLSALCAMGIESLEHEVFMRESKLARAASFALIGTIIISLPLFIFFAFKYIHITF